MTTMIVKLVAMDFNLDDDDLTKETQDQSAYIIRSNLTNNLEALDKV